MILTVIIIDVKFVSLDVLRLLPSVLYVLNIRLEHPSIAGEFSTPKCDALCVSDLTVVRTSGTNLPSNNVISSTHPNKNGVLLANNWKVFSILRLVLKKSNAVMRGHCV